MPDAAEAQMMKLMLYYPGVYLMKKTPFAITMECITMTMNAAHIMEDITAIADMKAVTAIYRNDIPCSRAVF
jgi:hypothetical protein